MSGGPSKEERAALAEHLFFRLTTVSNNTRNRHRGRFREEVLGAGAFGTAYRVGDLVVKVVKIGSMTSLENFLTEVETWEELSKHRSLDDYLPKTYGTELYVHHKTRFDEVQQLPLDELFRTPGVTVVGCLFQEYEPVEPLDSVLHKMGKIRALGSATHVLSATRASLTTAYKLREEGTATKFINNLIRAYNALHAEGFVHRDIKPGNILVRTDPDKLHIPIIIDVGLACKMPCMDTGLKGTFRYMPSNVLPTNRRNNRTFSVAKNTRGVLGRLGSGLKTVLGLPHQRPVKPTRKAVRIRAGLEELRPVYTAHTDNYALGITLQDIIKRVDWKTDELKEHYEEIAARYLYSMSAFLAAAWKPLQNLKRDRKNAAALAAIHRIDERVPEALDDEDEDEESDTDSDSDSE